MNLNAAKVKAPASVAKLSRPFQPRKPGLYVCKQRNRYFQRVVPGQDAPDVQALQPFSGLIELLRIGGRIERIQAALIDQITFDTPHG